MVRPSLGHRVYRDPVVFFFNNIGVPTDFKVLNVHREFHNIGLLVSIFRKVESSLDIIM